MDIDWSLRLIKIFSKNRVIAIGARTHYFGAMFSDGYADVHFAKVACCPLTNK